MNVTEGHQPRHAPSPENGMRRSTGHDGTPPKDFWDKLSSLSALASGVLIGGVGLYATLTYNSRQLASEALEREREIAVRRVEVVERFFPHLASTDDNVREAALETIASLGDEALAGNLARRFGGRSGASVLANLSRSSDPAVATAASETLTEMFPRVRESITQLMAKEGPNLSLETAFFVRPDGTALVAYHATRSSGSLSLRVGGKMEPARVVASDWRRDIALVRPTQPVQVLPMNLRAAQPVVGGTAIVIGFVASRETPLSFSAHIAAVDTTVAGVGRILLDAAAPDGFLGAAAADPGGDLLGLVVGLLATDSGTFTVLSRTEDVWRLVHELPG